MQIAAYHRYAAHRYCTGTVCTGLAGSVYSVRFGRPAENGIDHYLLKAGLSLNIADLRKVGRPAVLMSCLPASFEILGYFLFAPYLLGITRIEAAVMGAVLGAVSPAIVVPRMVQLMEQKYGTEKASHS